MNDVSVGTYLLVASVVVNMTILIGIFIRKPKFVLYFLPLLIFLCYFIPLILILTEVACGYLGRTSFSTTMLQEKSNLQLAFSYLNKAWRGIIVSEVVGIGIGIIILWLAERQSRTKRGVIDSTTKEKLKDKN